MKEVIHNFSKGNQKVINSNKIKRDFIHTLSTKLHKTKKYLTSYAQIRYSLKNVSREI
jgi:hypothetical protein